ncbi:TDP-N-acetylfucosamine:lipid II N-acetylfucosaminyltransferase [Marinobacterium rhizophilum]|uniref:TDP-N-acetylfucosamine:lipid II N-acetylfucosaminyltransferase n=1 Tax=Marinobacterium rhizophilum TaxID=420402 RepID=UPI0003AAD9AF|nr:TDP-N-acetylfucosamine:lipid II N-acetylfucosaminyltransferase [Marinobacterium rhizophilum]
MIRILHIIKDEKFIDSAYAAFESAAPGINDYVVLGESRSLSYIKTFLPEFSGKKPYLNSLFVDRVNRYEAVVIHGLTRGACEIVSRIKSNTKILWIGMGFDYYDLIYKDHRSMIKNDTRMIYKKDYKNSVFKKVKGFIYKVFFDVGTDKIDVLKRINYFAPVLPSEFGKVKSINTDFNFDYLDWNYGVVAPLVDGDVGCYDYCGNNIIVGNSATPTNNHIEAFELINNEFLGDRIVYCPLSYGDSKYAQVVLEYGRKIFGERFVGLTDFMSLDKYVEILANCSVVIMNHIRQQAGANILMSVYLGSRVILDSRNPFYDYLRTMGVVLNSVDDLKINPRLIDVPLTPEEKYKNKKLIKSDRSWEAVMFRTRCVLNVLSGQKTYGCKHGSEL